MWCFSKTLTLLRASVQKEGPEEEGETPTSSGNAEDSTSVDMLQTRSLVVHCSDLAFCMFKACKS